jgi:hypothetical protein
MFVTAVACEHRVFQRIMAVLCAASALVLVVTAALFALDAVQVRSLMRPEAQSSWAVATLSALVKFGVAIVAVVWFAIASFRGRRSPASPARKSPTLPSRSSGADLVVGQRTRDAASGPA